MIKKKKNIKSLSLEELEKILTGLGLRKFRARQLFHWIYGRLALSFEEMTNVGKQERELLSSLFSIPSLTVLETEQSSDGTVKFLFGLEDGHTVESVLIPDDDRLTLCISSQVGCGQACAFCLTGKGGLVRNLEAGEIVDQILEAFRRLKMVGHGPRITNIVLMGMGEPLANFSEVSRALSLITSSSGFAMSPRRVTLSTAGLVPEIDRLAKSVLRVNLAVSLNASTDEERSRIMPVNRRWPIKDLLAACRRFPLEPRKRITFEYVMLKGINDAEQDAKRVSMMLRGIRCKVNLIPFNPYPGCGFERPDDRTVRRFQKVLLDGNYTAPVRESRGCDISAACGQLRERIPLMERSE